MMRAHVGILAGERLFGSFFSAPALARLGRLADWERIADTEDSPSLRAAIRQADALVTTWQSPFLRVEMLEGSSVRAIVHCGGELRARMEDEVLDRVIVVNTPEAMASPVAEMAMALILALVRRVIPYDRGMHDGASAPGNETAVVGESLAGRRVGIVGFGRVGRALGELLGVFGVDVVASDPYASDEDARGQGARLVDLDLLVQTSSVVVLTAALTAETRNLFDRRRLGMLPDGAALVNVGRGALVDLDALVDELARDRISAALDVTDPLEPLPRDHRLRRLPNVILTPHVAGGGVETRHAMAETAIDELGRILRGESPRNHVTRPMLARMT